MTIVEQAAERLRELLPSFRDPSHYANHEDIALVTNLELLAENMRDADNCPHVHCRMLPR